MERQRDRLVGTVILDAFDQQVDQSGLLRRGKRFPQRVERLDGPGQFVRVDHPLAKPGDLGVDLGCILLAVVDLGLQ